jgi:hypothetical protein
MLRTCNRVEPSEMKSEARAVGAEAMCTCPGTVRPPSPLESATPPATPTATSTPATSAAGNGRRASTCRRHRPRRAGRSRGRSDSGPAAVSSSASERTTVMMRSLSSGGGATWGAASGSVSTTTWSSATSREQSTQAGRWVTNAACSSSGRAPSR